MTTETKKDRTPAGAPSNLQLDDKLASILLSSICTASREHPVKRSELAQICPGEDAKDRDRTVRRYIQKMRLKGTPICSSSQEGGYWLAHSMEEYLRFDRQYTSHAKQIFKASKAMRRTMREQEDRVLYEKMLEEYSADPNNM